jgi:aspartate aminotransferase
VTSELTAVPAFFPRAETIPASWLHKVFRAVENEERRSGMAVTKLHVGEPYFRPPAQVAAAFAEATSGPAHTDYIGVEGLLALRESLVRKLANDNGINTDPAHVFTTPGSCEGLLALMRCLARPGAQMLLPEIHWPVHLQQCLLAGIEPVFYRLDDEYLPDLDSIITSATPRTSVLLVNSPSNPTGAVLPRDRLESLLQIARSQGWQVISDEAYEDFVYDGEHISLAALEQQDPHENHIVHTTFTFSKGMAMTGYRLGYVVTADARTAETLRTIQESSLIAPATPVQYAGLAAVAARAAVTDNAALVRRNRDEYLPMLVEAGLLHGLPAGGWYAMVDIGCTGMDSETFAERLLRERNVAVVPGSGFALRPRITPSGELVDVTFEPSSARLIRIAFCIAPDELAAGVRHILEFVDETGRHSVR